jgi:hypothetical protein
MESRLKAKEILKWPLILAAVVVIARVVLEQAGAPNAVNNLVSVVMLYLVICPLYFAYRLAKSDTPRPYPALLKIVVLYAILARAMVIPTYWLAYIYQWPQARFSAANGGVVGPDITPMAAYIVVPLVALLAWTLASAVIGGGLGSLLIAIKRR